MGRRQNQQNGMCIQRRLRSAWASLATHWAHSEDWSVWMPRLIWVFAWRTGHYVGFVVLRLILILSCRNFDVTLHDSHLMYLLFKGDFLYLLSPVKRICVFEHSVMTNFNCACPAIQRGQGSGFLSEGSSWLTITETSPYKSNPRFAPNI